MARSQDKTEFGFLFGETRGAKESLSQRPIDRFLEKIEKGGIAFCRHDGLGDAKLVGSPELSTSKVGF